MRANAEAARRESARAATSRRAGWVISCEHGGRRIPDWIDSGHLGGLLPSLNSHLSYDPGAALLALHFARPLDAPVLLNTVTRLLVDANRSLDHRDLFRNAPATLDDELRARLINEVHQPHFMAVREAVGQARRRTGLALLVSVHSFAPLFAGQRRRSDIGLLYDPARPLEAELARAWQSELRRALPDMVVHRNRPYRGVSDGVCRQLRRLHPPEHFVGLELEVNQRFEREGGPAWRALRELLPLSLRAAWQSMS